MSKDFNANLATELQAYARQLSYNDLTICAPAGLKSALLEASRALDATSIRAHKKCDGVLLVTARGQSRYATWRERLAMWLLRGTRIHV